MERLSSERFLEIVSHKEICEFCPDIGDADVCVKCEKVIGITFDELKLYYSRLKDLAAAQQEGRLATLPVKPNEVIYVLGSPPEFIEEWEILHPSISYSNRGIISTIPLGILVSSIGENVFFTRAEADAALAEKRGDANA